MLICDIMKSNKNKLPDTTVAKKVGGTIYVKIPPAHLKHHNLEVMKEENINQMEINIQKEISTKGEHYGSFWNPEHPSQSNDQ